MLRKVDKMLRQCKGKTTIKKFENLLKSLEHMAKYDFDILMRGNNIPYRVTVAAGVSKIEWDNTPDEGIDFSVEHEDPDQLGKLAFAAIQDRRNVFDTTFTFIDYESQTIKVRVKGDNYSMPIFIAYFRGKWNQAADDVRRVEEHNSKKEDWRRSL